jgi:acyl-CoA synthetase (AMP-forming)/AMP-acid ligase II
MDFNNAHLLRATLPRDLLAPIPLFDNREEKHHELATALRETQASRKVAAANKKRARAQDDNDAEEETPAPKKRKKSKAKRGRTIPPAESIVVNRTKRQVKPTAKAKAAAAAEESEEEAEESSSDDSGDDANVLQYASDSTDYSDSL